LRSIPDSRSNYLPEAEKNILLIFENVPGYEFLYSQDEPIYAVTLCDLINLLPRNIVNDINNVKSDMINSGIFQKKITNLQTAACIYYVCNIMQKKRLEIILPETDQRIKITHSLLSSKCGSFSSATLTKQVNIIDNFYK
jgi:hypothetical protein